MGGFLDDFTWLREAISLAPRLQPGGQGPQNHSLNRFNGFSWSELQTKTVRNGFLSVSFWYHRAKAAVLMRSLRVPRLALSMCVR